MPTSARLYIGGVIACAAIALGLSVLTVPHDRLGRVIVLALLLVIAGRISEHEHHAATDSHLTLGTVIVLAALLLTGPAGAVIVAAADFLAQTEQRVLVKRAFNAAETMLAAGVAGFAMMMLGGNWQGVPIVMPAILLPALAANLVLYLVTSVLVGVVIAATSSARPAAVARGIIDDSAVPELGYGTLGIGLAVVWQAADIGAISAVLIVAPLFFARRTYALYSEGLQAQARTIAVLVQAVETKDVYTRGHSERVAKAAVLIARESRMPEARIPSLRAAAVLHDVGKLGVPTRVLQKTGRLSEDEFGAIKQHPLRGHEITHGIEFLEEARGGILHHHERMDGTGYPMGLKGDDIPEFGRLICVADAFDSMTSTRSYRGARSVEEALEELVRCTGTQFDRRFVQALAAGLARTEWQPTTDPAEPVIAAIPKPRGHYDDAARAGDIVDSPAEDR